MNTVTRIKPPEASPMIDSIRASLEGLLARQKAACRAEPMPSLAVRQQRLARLHNVILDCRQRMAAAAHADFSARASAETDLGEVLPLLEGIAYYRKRLKRLMKPQRRHAPLTVLPGKAEVHYQPLGVVGIVVPWNFPFFLALSPRIGALAAGNRALLKTSEFAPARGELLQKLRFRPIKIKPA